MPDSPETPNPSSDPLQGDVPSVPSKYVPTKGIIGLLASDDIPMSEIKLFVAKFDQLTKDDGTQAEHGLGMFNLHGEPCIWKIEYLDQAQPEGSEAPKQTLRVLTILLASEY